MGKQNKYRQYENLGKALSAEYPNGYSLGTFLLDAIIENNGKIYAEQVYKANLIKNERNFTAWRDSLCANGWLGFTLHGDTKWKTARYLAGPKLIKYVNKELIFGGKSQIATTGYIQDVVEEARNALRQEMMDAIQKISEDNPPVTTEKLDKHLQLIGN